MLAYLAAMGRPKRSKVASRSNGDAAAKNKVRKCVPVMHLDYDKEFTKNGKRHLRIAHLPKPPKGYVYATELAATVFCLKHQRRVHFELDEPSKSSSTLSTPELHQRQRREAEKKALKVIASLREDPGSTIQKARSLAKRAGVEFAP